MLVVSRSATERTFLFPALDSEFVNDTGPLEELLSLLTVGARDARRLLDSAQFGGADAVGQLRVAIIDAPAAASGRSARSLRVRAVCCRDGQRDAARRGQRSDH
jgi:hypothetical protein